MKNFNLTQAFLTLALVFGSAASIVSVNNDSPERRKKITKVSSSPITPITGKPESQDDLKKARNLRDNTANNRVDNGELEFIVAAMKKLNFDEAE